MAMDTAQTEMPSLELQHAAPTQKTLSKNIFRFQSDSPTTRRKLKTFSP